MTVVPTPPQATSLHEEITTFLTQVGLRSPCCGRDTTGGFRVGSADGSTVIYWELDPDVFEDHPDKGMWVIRAMEDALSDLLRKAGYATGRGKLNLGVRVARASDSGVLTAGP